MAEEKEQIKKATVRVIGTTRSGKRVKFGPTDVTRKPGKRKSA